MGLFDSLLGGTRQTGRKPTSVWQRTIGIGEFTAATPDGQAVTAGIWFVWRYRVPAQQEVRVGSGSIVAGVDNRGVIMLDMQDDAPAQLNGAATVQIGYENANQTNFIPVWEGRLDQINNPAFAGIRQSNNVLGETLPGARQDSFLVIRVRPAVTVANLFSDADSDFRLPVTIYTY